MALRIDLVLQRRDRPDGVQHIERFLRGEPVDPDRCRVRLQFQVQQGIHRYA